MASKRMLWVANIARNLVLYITLPANIRTALLQQFIILVHHQAETIDLT